MPSTVRTAESLPTGVHDRHDPELRYVISVDGLSFLHPGAATGFDDVSFVVPRGVTAALIGDNGVGKTTLLRILAGELDADDGAVAITGTVRYMPQEVGFGDAHLSVRSCSARSPRPLDELSRRIAAAEARSRTATTLRASSSATVLARGATSAATSSRPPGTSPPRDRRRGDRRDR
jgi:ATPase subunit of ABC transporter with duplicated ATPase domains